MIKARASTEQKTRGQGPEHKILHGRLDRDHAVPSQGHCRIQGQRQQLDAQIDREQVIARDHHKLPQCGKEGKEVELAKPHTLLL